MLDQSLEININKKTIIINAKKNKELTAIDGKIKLQNKYREKQLSKTNFRENFAFFNINNNERLLDFSN